jgi:hypothetical protein
MTLYIQPDRSQWWSVDIGEFADMWTIADSTNPELYFGYNCRAARDHDIFVWCF